MGEKANKVIAVLTSGGDSQGMNAVIRAVVRMGLRKGFRVFMVYEGYNGLVEGQQFIKEANWLSVEHIIQKGGTMIGSSRCAEFREPEGRIKVALNLIQKDITNLVIIGGDGSLIGANILRQEWTSILNKLMERGKITEEIKQKHSYINIVGIVGSIDNDFCKTEITIGTDTALHRIIEAVDAIATTATSHQRVMIIEVMGRNCGYLALVSALATEATFTLIPESPPEEDWPQRLCSQLERERENGRRLNIIIVSEGAEDLDGKPITGNQIKDLIVDKTKRDTRVTILGHIQRGGKASAFDSILGSRMGAEAVDVLLESTPESESCVLAFSGNQVVRRSLTECVKQTLEVANAMKNKQWVEAIKLRGNSFMRNCKTYSLLNKPMIAKKNGDNKRLAVIQIGEPSPGINAAVFAFVRFVMSEGNTVFGVYDGIDGLIAGNIKQLKWSDVSGWTSLGGALLGTSDTLPHKQITQIVDKFKEFKIDGLLVIGGFKAFETVIQLIEARNKFNELKIPICIIPATINNNIPGTDFSLGTDSALNKITQLLTDIIFSTLGTKRRLYIVKLETGYCGYLTTMSALASGADISYIFEEDFTVNHIKKDISVLKSKIKNDNRNRLVLMNGSSNLKLKTESIVDIYTKESDGIFSTHLVDLTNLEQSTSPSPFDRIFGIKLGQFSAEWLLSNMKTSESENAVVIGLRGLKYSTTPVIQLMKNTDFELRIPKDQWYLKLRYLINMA